MNETKGYGITDDGYLINEDTGRVYLVKGITARQLQYTLNECIKENEQLKKEKEDWKINCSKKINQNQILWNEIFMMMEQGAETSEAFNKYLKKIQGVKR